VRRSAGCSPPVSRRRAAGEVGDSDESLLSEETSAEAAWPRSTTADGGRTRARARALHSVAEDLVTDEYTLTLGAHLLLWGFPLVLVLLVVAETLLDTWWREPKQ